MSEQLTITTIKNDITPRERRATHLQNYIRWRRGRIKDEFIGMGVDLLEFYESGLWVELKLNNFEAFLSTPEINLSTSLGYDLVRIGALLAAGFPIEKFAQIGISNLRLILPKLEAGEEIQKWLDLAEELTWRDLNDEMNDKNTQTYTGRGMLENIITELREKNEFWEIPVKVYIQTI